MHFELESASQSQEAADANAGTLLAKKEAEAEFSQQDAELAELRGELKHSQPVMTRLQSTAHSSASRGSKKGQ